MDEKDWLAERFERERMHLRGVAYRMLGSLSEADDAVQDAWLKLNRSGATGVQNLSGWLTTVVAHTCLDMLRSRTSRREDSMESLAAEPAVPRSRSSDPEEETLLAESVGLAVLVVLDTLAPPERLAFVLHDMFDLPFDEVARIIGRSPEAARQLASRARRRVSGADAPVEGRAGHRRVVETFVGALRRGDVSALIALLDPDLVVTADTGPAFTRRTVHGAENWASGAIAYTQTIGFFEPAIVLVDGAIALAYASQGRLSRVLNFAIKEGKISQIEVITNQIHLRQLSLSTLTD